MTVDLEWLTRVKRCGSCFEAGCKQSRKNLVDAINKKIAEAREEQREACATWCYDCDEIGGMNCCYATPLTSHPLRARVAELETHLGELTGSMKVTSQNAELRAAVKKLRASLLEMIEAYGTVHEGMNNALAETAHLEEVGK